MLKIENISKQYKTGDLVQQALDHVSLSLRDNEFVAILGPSGSGKTTLLNIIGGLDRYDSGDLIINGISTKKYKDRDWDSYRNHVIGFVFQSYNLIPHQTVLANVELALTISGISGSERKKRAIEALEKVGLGNQLHKRPSQMSGGQMQRVAIARALVNNPDILLADEPTGALDTETSVQVMELLKEVAKDRLVVMVTHNPELAYQYATRIVSVKDGKIISDTDPYDIQQDEKPVHKNLGKSSMSFLTALHLSMNNLRTKKTRTALVSFAGSIGIIGIALILSLSNGVNGYIQSVEEETLSQYPISITRQAMDMTSMMTNMPAAQAQENRQIDGITVMETVTSLFSGVTTNDLESLKTFLDENDSRIMQYANSVEYSYGISPQIYRMDDGDVRQVNPDQTMASLGFSSAGVMSAAMSSDTFHQLPEKAELYESQYDIKAGHWPRQWNEAVLVLSSSGSISDLTLYTLGLRDPDELQQMIQDFNNEKQVEPVRSEEKEVFAYDEMIGKSFKLVNSGDYYTYDQEVGVWTDRTGDTAYMKELVGNGEDLTIVGVVMPKPDSEIASLVSGINYPEALTRHIIEAGQQSEAAKAQREDPTVNIFTGNTFGEDNSDSDAFSFANLITVDEDTISSAFSIDVSKINVNWNGILSTMGLSESDIIQMLANAGVTVTQEGMQVIFDRLNQGFEQYLLQNPEVMSDTQDAWRWYMQSDEARYIIQDGINEMSGENYTQEQLQLVLQNIQGQMAYRMRSALNGAMNTIANAAMKGLRVDGDILTSAIRMNRSQEELQSLMTSMMSTNTASYENNLVKVGYAELDNPSSISIYPKDFESKEKIESILKEYNEQMKETDEDKVVQWTDLVGTLMSSVTKIVDTVSYVLIAFVSISLVVSSIMIGVITYISVLERRKEIGILRAIGASKHNIAQVFNAETFVTGALAGLIGIGITLLLQVPITSIMRSMTESETIRASISPASAFFLIGLSIVLTLLGGLIPSKKASHSDPVTALRSE